MVNKDDAAEGRLPENSPLNNSAFVINIPSYEEVIEAPQPNPASHSLFNPSSSFSDAFSFIKNTEFYSTPPPTLLSHLPSESSSSLASPARSVVQSEAPCASTSAVGANRNVILVSQRQKGNPLLKHIRNVRWDFADVVCDFLLGQNTCALYLSLRYHLLHPDYLYFRIRELQKNFKLRVVLCHVDVEDVIKPLHEVTKTALLHDCTLLCAWSLEECGRYLETIKVYEKKPADLIQGQMDMDYQSRLNHALTSIRHVNKTDVVTLGSTFGSLSHIMDSSMEDLARCPGIGERKVKRLYDTFHEPFKRVIPHVSDQVNTRTGSSSGLERNNGKEEIQDEQKQRKTEGETSVRSALAEAFAKYSDLSSKRKNNKKQESSSVKSDVP